MYAELKSQKTWWRSAHARFARGADEGVRPYIKSLVGFAEDKLSGGGAAFEVGLHQ
jgi:hypothetical protein